jgi:hypothetical protein
MLNNLEETLGTFDLRFDNVDSVSLTLQQQVNPDNMYTTNCHLDNMMLKCFPWPLVNRDNNHIDKSTLTLIYNTDLVQGGKLNLILQ